MEVNKDAEYFNEAAKMICGEISSVLMKIPDSRKSEIQEIRLRCGRPVALTSGTETLFVCSDGGIIYSPAPRAVITGKHHIFESFKSICGYSVYSKQSEIISGFITAENGCRIGICGTASVKAGEITAVTDITSMNIRISRQVFGAADKMISRLFPISGGILIAGPPGCGKTTILRDLAYNISIGKSTKIMRTCIIDERGELSGGNKGKIDTGLADVQVGYPKSHGIIQAIRALSPQVIICDEVGTDEDASAVAKGTNAGAYIIATVHAGSYEELMHRSQAKKLLETGAFQTVVILGKPDKPGRIEEIIKLNQGNN